MCCHNCVHIISWVIDEDLSALISTFCTPMLLLLFPMSAGNQLYIFFRWMYNLLPFCAGVECLLSQTGQSVCSITLKICPSFLVDSCQYDWPSCFLLFSLSYTLRTSAPPRLRSLQWTPLGCGWAAPPVPSSSCPTPASWPGAPTPATTHRGPPSARCGSWLHSRASRVWQRARTWA